jgi:HAE1 family hydrophobic/amphiphilic exporter-1
MFSRFFINRPIFAAVVSIIIIIVGLVTLRSLPVSQYPEIAPPIVRVSAVYPGAGADVIAKTVAQPIEEQVNGVEGMLYMSSSSTNNGEYNLDITFEVGTDLDMAQVLVQNRASQAEALLPADVQRLGLTVEKRSSSILLFAALTSPDDRFDSLYLTNYANINISDEISRLDGVGSVTTFGAADYSMRIWLNPEQMKARGLTTSDVVASIREQNIQVAAGQIGQLPVKGNQDFQTAIKVSGRLENVSEFENIILRNIPGQGMVRLKDIARVELGAQTYNMLSQSGVKESAAVAVFLQPGANALSVADNVKERMEELSKNFPEGMKYDIPFDTTTFVEASIDEVVETLYIAVVLVIIVILVFLQNWRAALIPIVTIPVSLIGTFAVMSALGVGINMLSMFGIVLAIGIVVDDAIVVVENVMRNIDESGLKPKQATIQAMQEVTGPIVATTLVLFAVFIPTAFLGGITGQLYRQFALTIATATFFSAVNALTLSPALSALLLRPTPKSLNIFARGFNAFFDGVQNVYGFFIGKMIRRGFIMLIIFLGITAATFWGFTKQPGGFIPNEDQGIIFCDITLPPGSTLDRTTEVAGKVESIIEEIDVVQERMFVIGFSLMSNTNGGSKAFAVIKLKEWNERKEDHQKVNSLIGQLFGRTAGISEARILFFAPPTVRGFGNSDGFEMRLQDKSNGEFSDLMAKSGQFLGALNQRPEIKYAITSFNTGFPQYEMEVNVEKVKEAGISVNGLFSTLQGYYGSWYAADFNRFGKQYRVMIQSSPEDRETIESMDKVYVRNAQNELVSVSQFVSLKKVNGPDVVNRFNLFNSATINGNVNPGYSTGDAIEAIREVAEQTLPSNYGYEFSGMTREEEKAGNQAILVFALSLIFVYFLLAAQYESYILPFSIILSLPIGIFGAIFFVKIIGLENNIYFQVALIMLIGLLAKNAILIVEFALQRRQQGMQIIQAAAEGAKARLRPILMTSFAFILGLLPLMLASGAGAVGNRSIGTGAVGGMLIGTVFGVFVIPAFFVIFQIIQEKISGAPKPEALELENAE